MFNKVLIALTLVFCISALPKYHELEGYNFERYIADFGKVYASHEVDAKKSVFEENLATIFAHNADETRSWKMGVNHFTDMTKEEFKQWYKGVDTLKFGADQKEVRFLSEEEDKSNWNFDLPATFDWRNTAGVVTAVKNQGGCGSCWAFAATETMESAVAISSSQTAPVLAPQQLVDCSPNPQSCGGTGGCEGSTAELGMDYIAKSSGMVLESDYPYQGSDETCNVSGLTPKITITGYANTVSNDENSFQTTLYNKGPLAISVMAETWQMYENGVFDGCDYSSNIDIDHGVQCVGWGNDGTQDYWLVRNSWGAYWGTNGYIYLAKEATTQCGTDSTPQDGIACKGDDSPQHVCGQCAIYFDACYPTGAKLL